MKQEVADYLSHKIKWILDKVGVPEDVAGKIDSLILLILVTIVTLLVAEVVYRVLTMASRRILRRKRYLFLEKLNVKDRLRMQAYMLPPIILNSMLQFIADPSGLFFHYTEKLVWIYFVVAVVMAVNALLSAVAD